MNICILFNYLKMHIEKNFKESKWLNVLKQCAKVSLKNTFFCNNNMILDLRELLRKPINKWMQRYHVLWDFLELLSAFNTPDNCQILFRLRVQFLIRVSYTIWNTKICFFVPFLFDNIIDVSYVLCIACKNWI